MNGDKLSTLHYLFTLAMQHSMIWVGTGLMAQSPTDASVEEGLFPGYLATAKKFGERIAHISGRWSGKVN